MKIALKLLVMLLFIFGLVNLKSKVVFYEKELVDINFKIKAAKEELNLLHTEYTYLTRPERIRKLALDKLQLRSPKPVDIVVENKNGNDNESA